MGVEWLAIIVSASLIIAGASLGLHFGYKSSIATIKEWIRLHELQHEGSIDKILSKLDELK